MPGFAEYGSAAAAPPGLLSFNIGKAPAKIAKRAPRRKKKEWWQGDDTWNLERLNEGGDKWAIENIDLLEQPALQWEPEELDEPTLHFLDDSFLLVPSREFTEYREPRDEIAEGLRAIDLCQHDPAELLAVIDKPVEPTPVTEADSEFIKEGQKVAEEIKKANKDGKLDKLYSEHLDTPHQQQDTDHDLEQAFKKLGLEPPSEFIRNLPPDPDETPQTEEHAQFARNFAAVAEHQCE